MTNTNHPNGKDHPVRFLIFSASMRADSLNTKLAKLAAAAIQKNGAIVDYAEMKGFDCPSYNQDMEKSGQPAGAMLLNQKINACDALVISSPEYNGSMPGSLKNMIDWVSRFKPQPFNEHHVFLMSASPSMVGGNRGLWSLRIPLEHLGARVFPDMFSLAQAHQALAADGRIINAQLSDRFEQTIVAFMDLVEAAKHYPCAKKAWFEYLGEQPNAAT